MNSPQPIDPATLHLPSPRGAGLQTLHVTPESAGWERAGLQVVRLGADEAITIDVPGTEHAVLPLVGGCQVEAAQARLHLNGRPSVFTHVSDWAYVGVDEAFRIRSDHGCEIAIASSRAERRIAPYRIDAADVAVEVRGAGHATRQLNNFLAPGIGDADRLVAVEVLTPRGNWSSWPPHKHDDASIEGSSEAELEEIYYYRISSAEGGAIDSLAAFGMHRTYDLAQGWDVSVAVRTGDVFLVPRGYHGPCIAAPEFDMYYLNVLAGPAAERSLAFTDDPSLAWVRESWSEQLHDPRVPFATATGPTGPGTRSGWLMDREQITERAGEFPRPGVVRTTH